VLRPAPAQVGVILLIVGGLAAIIGLALQISSRDAAAPPY
jgi:hypothetical protein